MFIIFGRINKSMKKAKKQNREYEKNEKKGGSGLPRGDPTHLVKRLVLRASWTGPFASSFRRELNLSHMKRDTVPGPPPYRAPSTPVGEPSAHCVGCMGLAQQHSLVTTHLLASRRSIADSRSMADSITCFFLSENCCSTY